MLARIEHLPEHVLGMRATGKVVDTDYHNVLFPAFTLYRQQNEWLYYIMVIETPIGNFSIEALLNDMVLGFQYFTRWKKVAIVSAERGVITFTNTVGKLLPGEYRGFHLSEQEKAFKWVSS
ncbi:STAS/SEC14 domain-containing protein [Segetibacter sp. 3557_3]|uniref:STAS/SEC14 domain-containing protein n=1 Tax=Segetibacter sp. 3557_3 TaxID=2547429 RepID=UPI0014053F49|nr:STAS/SEC14 domain-containing protein [Segetibacter sp. 3557_3]